MTDRRDIKDYSEIKEGMELYCIPEEYEGDVIMRDGVLQTDCYGFGYEPISNICLGEVMIIQREQPLDVK